MDEREGQESELKGGEHPADKTDKSDKTLKREAWAFHEIPEDELEIALRWELEVETGSGQPHWLELADDDKAPVLDYRDFCERETKPFREIQMGRGGIDYFRLHDDAHAQTPFQLHAVEIDWSASPTAIKDAFGKWVDSIPSWKGKGDRRRGKPGPKGIVSQLVDLAILRASEAGVNCKKGGELLWPLFTATAKQDRTSPSHWADAKRRARESIEAFIDNGGGHHFLAGLTSEN
jgi:hypothetical protein